MLSFIETTRLVGRYLSDDEYPRLQQALIVNPETGSIVRSSGGVRKLRRGVEGRGKSGGVRVIYYLRSAQGQIWMLTIYAKNEEQNIPGHILKRIKEEVVGKD